MSTIIFEDVIQSVSLTRYAGGMGKIMYQLDFDPTREGFLVLTRDDLVSLLEALERELDGLDGKGGS